MLELKPKSACDGLLPLSVGAFSLTEEPVGRITALAPLRGRAADLSDTLSRAHGMALPSVGRATGKAGARAIWFGLHHSLLMGPDPDPALAAVASVTDQTDAWAVVRLDGPGAETVLARLCPVDLRAAVFKRGHTARTQIMHMPGSVTRLSERAFQIMVFRSMAGTLVHDLKSAMEAVSARG
ncbi:MAG: sarcosine oxidase subunit gamma [Rhodobacteraceae bacterium]|nr:sarcosine oxidase subunit gamma [Paracoccaceae bacterium]